MESYRKSVSSRSPERLFEILPMDIDPALARTPVTAPHRYFENFIGTTAVEDPPAENTVFVTIDVSNKVVTIRY
jgi:hypothetical protein